MESNCELACHVNDALRTEEAPKKLNGLNIRPIGHFRPIGQFA